MLAVYSGAVSFCRGLSGTGFEPVGWNGVVGVASRYRPDGSVIESR